MTKRPNGLHVSRYLISEHGAIVAELYRENIISAREARELLGIQNEPSDG